MVLQLVSEERSRNVDLLASDNGDLLSVKDLQFEIMGDSESVER